MSGRGTQALVARGGETRVRDREQAGTPVPAHDLRSCICRTVVDDEDLQARVVERARVLEALVERRRRVVRAYDHAQGRPLGPGVADLAPVPVLGD